LTILVVTFPQYLLQYLLQTIYTSKIYIFLNHNTGTILVYNTGTNCYTSIVHNTSIPVVVSIAIGIVEMLLLVLSIPDSTRMFMCVG
jgi:hypothetical protein